MRQFTLALALTWLTLPSTFTHRDGVRVRQHTAEAQPTAPVVDVRTTGWRYTRSQTVFRGSIDSYQRVKSFRK